MNIALLCKKQIKLEKCWSGFYQKERGKHWKYIHRNVEKFNAYKRGSNLVLWKDIPRLQTHAHTHAHAYIYIYIYIYIYSYVRSRTRVCVCVCGDICVCVFYFQKYFHKCIHWIIGIGLQQTKYFNFANIFLLRLFKIVNKNQTKCSELG